MQLKETTLQNLPDGRFFKYANGKVIWRKVGHVETDHKNVLIRSLNTGHYKFTGEGQKVKSIN